MACSSLARGLTLLGLALPWCCYCETLPTSSDGKRALMRRDTMEGESTSSENSGEGFSVRCETHGDAMPGTPSIEGLQISKQPGHTSKRAKLGDRLVKAADATDATRSCGSFFVFGDYVWCNRAMPSESLFAKENRYSGYTCNVSAPSSSMLDLGSITQGRKENHGQYLALSYGIEETDPWSELMSSMYFVYSRLFDCYVDSTRGPMFNDMHGNHSRENECKTRNCYSIEYERNKVCLDKDNKEDQEHKRKYEPLADSLHGRPPLSTFVKMDVEGSEWGVLEQLLNSPEDIDRIRTLDMEIHMFFNSNDGISLERRVSIIEELAKKFAVTGSTIEPVFKNAHRDHAEHKAYWPPGEIHNSQGLPLDQFCMSFVNRRLLKNGEDTYGEAVPL